MSPRILLVVSGAYGDLSLAVSFAYGQEFAGGTAIALPDPLFRVNRDDFPVRLYRYRSAEHIERAALKWKARIVILLSGYGLPVEKVTSPMGLARLVHRLRYRGCHVLTTDPFLGLASTVTTADIHGMLPPVRNPVQKFLFARGAQRLAAVLKTSSALLRDFTHLYPMPTDDLANPDGLRRISFFNPDLTRREPLWGDATGTAGAGPAEWLFILAANDVSIQERKWGPAGFVRELARLFEHTTGAGRRPALMAPSALRRRLERALPASLDADFVPFCSYREFTSRLLAAEYAFYWNVFSCSAALVRMVRKLPVFFFGHGHVAQFDRRIYETGLRSYYGGWEPAQLESGPPALGHLAEVAASQARAVDGLVAYWRRSPTPSQVVETLLTGGTT